jgi:very-short-patch-repair endonuclease
MLRAGITAIEIRRRVKKGLLIRLHPGVYRVGHAAPSVEATFIAAVKACGEEAVLSGRAAGYLWGLIKGKPPPPEVTAPTERRVEGIKTRRSRSVQRTTHRGIPVTTVPQTLVDLAAVLPEDDLARACHEAGVRYRTTPRQVEKVLGRRKGAGRLRAVMRGDVHVTLSKLERAFLRLLRDAGLPLPVTNRVAGGRRVDCRWPEQKLTVELDSYQFHNTRHAWERDHARRREARARGEEFRRYTWTDLTEEAEAMVAEVRQLVVP